MSYKKEEQLRLPPKLKEVVIPKPTFLNNYREANFFSKIFFHYTQVLV